jgi:RimJ/RimL family protein N-acetyltransferase
VSDVAAFNVPDLVSTRLLLTPVTPAAATYIVEGVRQPEWAADFPQDGDMVIARMFHDHPPTTADGTSFGPRHLRLRATGELIGTAGFFGPPDEAGVVGLGYGVVPQGRGQGWATEALVALLGHAAADVRVRLVQADVSHENVASQRVMEKAGMTRVSDDDALYFYEYSTESPR